MLIISWFGEKIDQNFRLKILPPPLPGFCRFFWGYSADRCARKFPLVSMGGWVSREQTPEQGPPSTWAKILSKYPIVHSHFVFSQVSRDTSLHYPQGVFGRQQFSPILTLHPFCGDLNLTILSVKLVFQWSSYYRWPDEILATPKYHKRGGMTHPSGLHTLYKGPVQIVLCISTIYSYYYSSYFSQSRFSMQIDLCISLYSSRLMYQLF